MTDTTTIDYQHFFQQLLEATPWPMVIVDRTLAIRYYNQQALQLFEESAGIEGLNIEQFISDQPILSLIRQSIETGSAHIEEHASGGAGNVGKVGSRGAWKISVTPLQHTKTARGARKYRFYAVVIEDLTELRRLERARRDFIANISHELRTPLTSVRLLAETLEEAIDTDREQAQVFLEKIENEIQHLTVLVSELLDLSLIESGQTPMTMEPVEAEQLVREVMARMLPQAQRHRVILRTEIEHGKTLVAADSKHITRVLVNLAHNALKFTPSGGTVIIGTRPHIEGVTQDFFVRDTGVGIPPEDLPRIFERFYKVNRARSKADFIGPGGGGSGLGLAIARHVVEAHGGRIQVESTPGEGSIFTFTLPVSAHLRR